MHSTRRETTRHAIGRFVCPGPLVGTTEGFVVVNLSTGGMSLLRVAPTSTSPLGHDKKGLDMRFVWLTVPLPDPAFGRSGEFSALCEVVHRRRYGPLELIGVRFEEMSLDDGMTLYEYLDGPDPSLPGRAESSAA